MAVVYSAHDDVMGRPVAIKVMMADFEEDPETSARFYREARAAGQLVHRNIITIFDMGEEDGRPYIVMELLEGRTLSEYLKGPEASDVERNLDLMIQVCEGLQVAHLHGIYHRDVKPSNLSVSEDGASEDSRLRHRTPLLVEFDGQRLDRRDARLHVAGTGARPGCRSAFRHLLCRSRFLFHAHRAENHLRLPDLPGVLRKVELEDPLPIRETEAPPALARIVMKALAKSPAERYQQAAELIADLRRVKRDLELRAKQLTEEAITAACVDRVCIGRSRCRFAQRLAVAPQEDDEAIRERLVKGHPALATWPAKAPQVESLGLTAVTDLLSEIARVEELLSSETAGPATGGISAPRMVRARPTLATGGCALAHFDAAAQAVPSCSRAHDEAAKCRRRLLEQQAGTTAWHRSISKPSRRRLLGQWQTVIVLCEEALACTPVRPA